MSKYISGKEIINEWGIKPIELLEIIVKEGLQPHDQFKEQLAPPDVRWRIQEIEEHKAEIFVGSNDIKFLDSDIRQFESSMHYYRKRNPPQPSDLGKIGRCQQYILKKTREKDDIISKGVTLKNKIKLHLEYLELCCSRNSRKDLYSWENFGLDTLPLNMLGYQPDEAKAEILKQISSQETLYPQPEVEKIITSKKIWIKKQPTSGDQKGIGGSDHTYSYLENSLILEGDYWTVHYNDSRVMLRNLERLRYIIHLLDKPNNEFYPNDLICLVKGQKVNADKNYANMTREQLEEEGLSLFELPIEELSDKDKEGIENQVHALWNKLLEAKNDCNEAAIKEAEENWKTMNNHFYNEYGIKVGFTPKGPIFKQRSRLTKDAEKDRINVTKNINNAIKDIKKKLPQLASHLKKTIHTGATCGFLPDQDTSFKWNISGGASP